MQSGRWWLWWHLEQARLELTQLPLGPSQYILANLYICRCKNFGNFTENMFCLISLVI